MQLLLDKSSRARGEFQPTPKSARVDLECHVHRDITNPSLREIECKNAHRRVELAFDHLQYEGLTVRAILVRLPIGAAQRAEIIKNEIDVLGGNAGSQFDGTSLAFS